MPKKTRLKPKACPFCFGEPYFYKTRNGMIRHVQYSHIHDSQKRLLYPIFNGSAKFVRKDTNKGTELIEIEGWEEVEEFLEDYLNNYRNPSKRSSRLWKYVD